ncbi:hypothetical protein VTK56DRAFT_6751 [Thermocarpiscus australiensis]
MDTPTDDGFSIVWSYADILSRNSPDPVEMADDKEETPQEHPCESRSRQSGSNSKTNDTKDHAGDMPKVDGELEELRRERDDLLRKLARSEEKVRNWARLHSKVRRDLIKTSKNLRKVEKQLASAREAADCAREVPLPGTTTPKEHHGSALESAHSDLLKANNKVLDVISRLTELLAAQQHRPQSYDVGAHRPDGPSHTNLEPASINSSQMQADLSAIISETETRIRRLKSAWQVSQ